MEPGSVFQGVVRTPQGSSTFFANIKHRAHIAFTNATHFVTFCSAAEVAASCEVMCSAVIAAGRTVAPAATVCVAMAVSLAGWCTVNGVTRSFANTISGLINFFLSGVGRSSAQRQVPNSDAKQEARTQTTQPFLGHPCTAMCRIVHRIG